MSFPLRASLVGLFAWIVSVPTAAISGPTGFALVAGALGVAIAPFAFGTLALAGSPGRSMKLPMIVSLTTATLIFLVIWASSPA